MELKFESLKTASEYIGNLKIGIINASESFQSDNENKALESIPLIIDGIEWLVQVIQLTKDIQKSEISLDGLNEKLEKIIEAVENSDFILVGDLFQYELMPIIEEIEKNIDSTLAS
ncbi:hypothetical protein ACP49_14880 [Clostridium botulinum]|uniref:hypothetical protein n=1 Tax=Clostridium botulinum TaxID=1491 RepID=UPI0005F89A06|nr:hypothetical protein [Clostridium botulinum]KOM96830.1 hypothetical protein ACP53_10055 [Clostridium botulinum]KOM99247.1 hypothetical protein ACP49_14880 [Clostridium botulinum]MBY7004815.1 hypothetical protein [Clostridium botulinum]MCR1147482.1 hypothetical protein [Clostridium botulinum]NFH94241.1 hypothetical protein [Clostridium botulinum]